MCQHPKLEWNLDAYMREHGLGVDDVSNKTGIHRNIISKIKNNKQQRIDLHSIERLLIGLDLSPNQLFRWVYKDD